MMRRFLCAGACALLMAGSAAAKPGVAMTTVNLRAEANTTSEVLVKIPGSGRLDVGECRDGWCAVSVI
jgi:SH3-like domain-containing protein